MFGYTVGPSELILVLAVLVLLFGSKKLPELARGMGQAIKEFKQGIHEAADEDTAAKSPPDAEKKEE
jgi:sec-independent protein translocase protein TatA